MRRSALIIGATMGAVALATAAFLQHDRPRVGQNVFVNPAGIIDAFSTPAIALNPRRAGNLAIAYREDRPDLSARLGWTTDAGATWRPTSLPLPATIDRPFFPDATFAADGTLYLTYVNLGGRGNIPENLWFARSADGGATVAPPALVTQGTVFQPRIAVGPEGTIHLTWLRSTRIGQTPLTGEQVRVETARSNDGGRTWSDPVSVNPGDGRLVSGASAVVDGKGLTIVYQRFGTVATNLSTGGTAQQPESHDILVARSSDGGATFSPPTVVTSGIRASQRFSLFFPQFPSLAVAPDGARYLAWAESRGRGQDVLVARSLDVGASWSPPVRANDNRAGDGTSRSLPAMSIAANGRIDLLFIDQRGDPSGTFAEVYLASSRDGARSFHDIRLSTAPFDTRVGPSFGGGLPPDIGSHLGVVSLPSTIQATWADSRLGNETTGRQDIITARVLVAGSGSSRRRWLGAASVTVLLGAVVAALAEWARRTGTPT